MNGTECIRYKSTSENIFISRGYEQILIGLFVLQMSKIFDFSLNNWISICEIIPISFNLVEEKSKLGKKFWLWGNFFWQFQVQVMWKSCIYLGSLPWNLFSCRFETTNRSLGPYHILKVSDLNLQPVQNEFSCGKHATCSLHLMLWFYDFFQKSCFMKSSEK